ncbi:helix-turn-helix domain-containing protein [Methylobacterium sp. J-088]|uniref:helix-turn-helix domain-containing protein n=1 Tax=Methylobacterium sp. J-088 TaxID=2836664 RepID=UPI001FB925B9|nr:helix-turn-helix domain-containing protein [Methylobacterium sp. J-088]MCJ2063671.1 helix-turn-helix domain-containing protein [Methylobacterium sp. J-088]
MQTLFSTDGVHPKNAFRLWREMVCERLVPADLRILDDVPFQGRMDVTGIGPLLISHFSHTTMRTEATADTVRRNGRHDRVYAIMRISGQDTMQQGDQEAVSRAGDFIVVDARPAVFQTETGSALVLDLPRERFEAVLGPSRLFSALTVSADLASTTLARTYIQELVRVGDQLTPDASARMASIGSDLLMASLAERLAQEVPRSTHGTVTVQRAKAYIEANLSDQTLDPPQLAVAVGVSLRRLQELFHERGRHISDYIWERRLEVAARRLIDPACAHLSIGLLAYGSGFTSQAHFARRFKERHGLTPTEFRQASRQTSTDARPRKRPARIQGLI